jgi:hypothetical protein
MPCAVGSGIDGSLLAIHYSFPVNLPIFPILAVVVAIQKDFRPPSKMLQILEMPPFPQFLSKLTIKILDRSVHPRLHGCDKHRLNTKIQT